MTCRGSFRTSSCSLLWLTEQDTGAQRRLTQKRESAWKLYSLRFWGAIIFQFPGKHLNHPNLSMCSHPQIWGKSHLQLHFHLFSQSLISGFQSLSWADRQRVDHTLSPNSKRAKPPCPSMQQSLVRHPGRTPGDPHWISVPAHPGQETCTVYEPKNEVEAPPTSCWPIS